MPEQPAANNVLPVPRALETEMAGTLSAGAVARVPAEPRSAAHRGNCSQRKPTRPPHPSRDGTPSPPLSGPNSPARHRGPPPAPGGAATGPDRAQQGRPGAARGTAAPTGPDGPFHLVHARGGARPWRRQRGRSAALPAPARAGSAALPRTTASPVSRRCGVRCAPLPHHRRVRCASTPGRPAERDRSASLPAPERCALPDGPPIRCAARG